jgi:hypothetical protein
MNDLGLRVKEQASMSKQSVCWTAYDADDAVSIKYERRYTTDRYDVRLELVSLHQSLLNTFYGTLRTLKGVLKE